MQTQLKPEKSKMKTETFRNNAYSKATLFDYANYTNEKVKSMPARVMRLKKAEKMIQVVRIFRRKRTIPEKREEGTIKSARRDGDRKWIPSVLQDETAVGGEPKVQKPEEKRDKFSVWQIKRLINQRRIV